MMVQAGFRLKNFMNQFDQNERSFHKRCERERRVKKSPLGCNALYVLLSWNLYKEIICYLRPIYWCLIATTTC